MTISVWAYRECQNTLKMCVNSHLTVYVNRISFHGVCLRCSRIKRDTTSGVVQYKHLTYPTQSISVPAGAAIGSMVLCALENEGLSCLCLGAWGCDSLNRRSGVYITTNGRTRSRLKPLWDVACRGKYHLKKVTTLEQPEAVSCTNVVDALHHL